MEGFLKAAADRGHIAPLPPGASVMPAMVAARADRWLPDGVCFDWAPLHAAMGPPCPSMAVADHAAFQAALREGLKACGNAVPGETPSPDAPPFDHEDLSDLMRFEQGRRHCNVASVELWAPWQSVPLNDDASARSCFEACPSAGSATRLKFGFKKGAPGQRASAAASRAFLLGVVKQLRQQGVNAHLLLSSVAVVAPDGPSGGGPASDGFQTAMRQAAAVHSALKAAGLTIHGGGSAFGPRGTCIPSSCATAPVSTAGATAAGEDGHVRLPQASTPLPAARLESYLQAVEFFSFAVLVLATDAHLWGGRRSGWGSVAAFAAPDATAPPVHGAEARAALAGLSPEAAAARRAEFEASPGAAEEALVETAVRGFVTRAASTHGCWPGHVIKTVGPDAVAATVAARKKLVADVCKALKKDVTVSATGLQSVQAKFSVLEARLFYFALGYGSLVD